MRTTILHFIVITVVFLLVFALCMPELFFNLNNTLISATGDGIKNYYTVLYHIKYGSGFWFKGFAYPYGELLNFTDGQPALAYPLSLLTKAGVPVANYSLAILNGSMLLSVIVCAWFLYLIFLHYKVHRNWALVFALLIALLSPQLERIYGHYSLSYCFVFPSIWYCLIKFNQSNYSIKWFVIIVVTIFIYAFLHGYFLAIGSFFLVFYALVLTIANIKQVRNHLKSISFVALAGISPIVLFSAFVAYANPINDRIDVPWGFCFYRANFSSLFYSVRSPLSLALPEFIKPKPIFWEGFAYLGFWALFIALFVLMRWLVIVVKKRKITVTPLTTFNNQNHTTVLFAGGLMFLFANSFPFYNYPFNEWADYLPMVKQFRSTGRFAWVCYYIITVIMCLFVYYKYTKWRASGRIALAWGVMLMFVGVMGYEALYILKSNWKLAHTKEKNTLFFSYNPNSLLAELNSNPEQFQALISFPFYGVGTEKISADASDESLFHSLKWSYNTGLPLLNFNMSRASQSITSTILQLMSSPIITKAYPNMLKDKRPFLLLTTDSVLLNENELSIIKVAKQLVTSKHGFKLYSLQIDSINAIKEHLLHTLNESFLITHQRVDTNKIKLIDFNFNMLDFKPYTGAFTSEAKIVYEGSVLPEADSLIEVSFWATANPRFWGMAALRLEQLDSNNNIVEEKYSRDNRCIDIINTWQLVWLKTKLLHPKNTIKVTANGNRYYYTNIMIKPVFDTITSYDISQKTWYINNKPFKTEIK